jgi:hypothetical protein
LCKVVCLRLLSLQLLRYPEHLIVTIEDSIVQLPRATCC